MKSIILNEPTRFAIESLSEPDSPGHNEVLVGIHRVGICGTDLHAYQGRQPFFSYPRILGHELGVEILKTGEDVQHIQPGDRCAVIPYMHCGACLPCRMGKTNCCT
ncbi:MAG: alcohol dehydrogenase catalytic domain-containing protein, partial [Candidatus Latescibacteria bacterium]|nr:alcohol dehydrogenase catalytic domain-containing protein [Candidatus Latescibacterota bacterium]